jgi:selenocysteine lyase/cysteine desulfurase
MRVSDVAAEFGPFDGRVWLNTAHQGPLPWSAVAAANRAADLKAAPHRIADADFADVPEELRRQVAELIGAEPDTVALGNSTSHGLHAIANGLSWTAGDEVVVLAGDYPATVLPWQRLADRGVRLVRLRPRDGGFTAAELADAIGPRTRVVALTWVDSFTGRALDLDALGTVCRRAGVPLVVNASQALGARPLDVGKTPVDAVVCCGYKWLCGPYGTGFAWLHPNLLDAIEPQHAYWLAMQAGRGLDRMRDTTIRDDLGVRALDVFCPANFHNSLPWLESLRLFRRAGVDAIADHDQHLVEVLLAGLDTTRYTVVSPPDGPARSTLVVLADRTGATERRHRQLTDAGVDVAYREGNLRLSIHLFTTADDIDRVLDVLHTPLR